MIYPLPFAASDLASYGSQIGVAEQDVAAHQLARAIASSPGWERFPGCSLLVRSEPAALAVVGDLTESQQQELAAQADALRHRCYHFRYVSYQRAEAEAARLAGVIGPWLDDPAWQGCHFAAIPRGGYVVLGMLATLLDLPRERLRTPPTPQTPVVVVDDCALSGTRFREYLGTLKSERIAFVHLYSPAELRAAITAAEPRVLRCVAAADLTVPPMQGPVASPWWAELPGQPYWRGTAEFVAFAWGEPDRVVGSADRAPLAGWKLLPPDLCLKHRLLPSIPVSHQARGREPFRAAPGVLFAEVGDDMALAGGGSGQVLRLSGVAADIWRLLLATGSLTDTQSALSDRYAVETAELERDLHRLVDELRTLGFLEGE